jgi:site-specific DNA recombinase
MKQGAGIMRAVLYARKSTLDSTALGIPGQLKLCRDHAIDNGWTIVDELAENERASGVDINLPQLTKIRDMAAAGKFDVLVVREIDRLSRSLAKQLIVEEELKTAGVAIEYARYQYPETPEGRFMKHVRASVAELEREKIVERTRHGRREAVKAGRIMLHGDRPPYGHRVVKEHYRTKPDGTELWRTKTIEVYEPEAQTIRDIYRWYTDTDNSKRLALRTIARRLTEMGVPTWADIHRNGGNGRSAWTWKAVVDILKSETYAGVWRYGRRNGTKHKINPLETCLKLEVPAIVSRDLWDRAQRQRGVNRVHSKRNTKWE